MFKDTEVIAALIAGVTVILAELMKIIYSYLKDKKTKKDELIYFIDNDYEIDKKIWTLLNNLNADRVYVGRFHNGGSYDSGTHIRKFSITNEAFSDNVDQLIVPSFRERLISEFTNLFRPLIFTGFIEVKPEVKHPDKVVEKFIEAIGGKTVYLYCIRSLNGKPMGFLGIHYNIIIDLPDEKKETILTFAQTLVPYLGEPKS